MSEKKLSFPRLPTYAAEVTPVYWEPVMGSGERLTALIAAIGKDGKVSVITTISPSTLKILYESQSGSALHILSWVAESLKVHLTNSGSISGWKPPLSGISFEEKADLLGDDIGDILHQAKMLYSSLYTSERSDAEEEAFMSLNNEKLRHLVLDNIRRKEGIRADSFIVDGGTIEVRDPNRNHYLDIPIKNETKVASIVSAWYKSPVTIERNLLVAGTHLLVASERGRYEQGVFISRPTSGISSKQIEVIDNKLDFLIWSMEKNGVFATVQESPEELAEDVCNWIN
jgi:hypothetical protein